MFGYGWSTMWNSYDLLREMHLAAILHDGVNQTPGAVTAEEVLEMATIHGARALGLEDEVGSLEMGKKADFVVLDVRRVGCAPWDEGQVEQGGLDPVTVVVHSVSFALSLPTRTQPSRKRGPLQGNSADLDSVHGKRCRDGGCGWECASQGWKVGWRR